MICIFLILAFVLQPIAGLGVAVRLKNAGTPNLMAGVTVVNPRLTPLASSCCSDEVKVIEVDPSSCCKVKPAVAVELPNCGCDMSGLPAQDGRPLSDGFPVERPGQLRSVELLTLLHRSTFFADVDPLQDSLRRRGFSEFDGRSIAALSQRQAHALLCVWQT